jgi:hypothetical protein
MLLFFHLDCDTGGNGVDRTGLASLTKVQATSIANRSSSIILSPERSCISLAIEASRGQGASMRSGQVVLLGSNLLNPRRLSVSGGRGLLADARRHGGRGRRPLLISSRGRHPRD